MESKVAQFVAVTGAPSTTARNLLEACGENLDLAINMYLESGGDTVPATAAGPSGHNSVAGVADVEGGGEMLSPTSYQEKHGVRAPIPQTRGVLIEDEPAPNRVVRSRRLPRTVFDPFQDYSAAATARKLPGPGDEKHKRNLSELFKPPHDILFNGTFQEARVAGELRRCWLLVNMQDSKEFACQVLNRDLWSNFNIKDIVGEHFVFMQLHRITDSGVRFKQLYNVDSFPYIAIIDPRTGEKMAGWNSLTVTEFMKVIPEFLANNLFTGADQCDHHHQDSRKESVAELSEESQLEAAIRASLQVATHKEKSKSNAETRTTSKYQLIFSDDSEDECITVSSDDEAIYSDMDIDFVGNDHTQSSSEQNSKLWKDKNTISFHNKTASHGPDQDDIIEVESSCMNVKPSKQKEVRHERRNRKRHLSSQALDDHAGSARKVLRIDDSNEFVTDTHESMHVTQPDGDTRGKSNENKSSRTNKSKLKMLKGSPSKETRATTKGVFANSNHAKDITLEEQLASGSVKKEDLVQIVLRLPDGARLQKSFMCTHPIEDLFSFLQTQGLDTNEHEVMTHFPKRNISELEHSTNFKDAGLYPRETLFIHSVE